MPDEQPDARPEYERLATPAVAAGDAPATPRAAMPSEEWLKRQEEIALVWERQRARRDLIARLLVVFAVVATLVGVCMLAIPSGPSPSSRSAQRPASRWPLPGVVAPTPARPSAAPVEPPARAVPAAPTQVRRPVTVPRARSKASVAPQARVLPPSPRTSSSRPRRRSLLRTPRERDASPPLGEFDRGAASILDRLQ